MPLQRLAAAASMLAVLLGPIWAFDVIPATDLPNHLAVSSVLYRLLTDDPIVSAYYRFNIQPVPYYLVYAVMAPCVGWFGAWLGAKLVMSLLALTFAGAMALLARECRASWLALWGTPFAFYSVSFFWGFVASLMAMPFVLITLWALLRWHTHRRTLSLVWVAIAGTTLAGLAHVFMVLPCALAWTTFALMTLSHRRRWIVLLTATVSVAVVAVLIGNISTDRAHVLQFDPIVTMWDRVKTHLGAFDKGPGRAAHMLLVCVALGLTVHHRMAFGPNPTRRFLTLFALTCLAAFLAFPTRIHWYGLLGWGLNFRLLTFAEVALLLLAVPPRRFERVLRNLGAMLLGVFALGLVTLWSQYNQAVAPLRAVLTALAPNRTLQIVYTQERFAQAPMPLLNHVGCYYVAAGGAYGDQVFQGGHLPIRRRDEVPRNTDDFDYVLLQDSHAAGAQPSRAPHNHAVTLRSAGRWRLYGRLEGDQQAIEQP